MADPTKRISRLMQRVKKDRLPSSQHIVREIFEQLGLTPGALDSEQILSGFNGYLRSLWEETLKTLEAYERQIYATGIPEEFMKEFAQDFEAAEREAAQKGFRGGFIRLFDDLYPWFRRAFLSISQSRMTRGGKDFELQIEGLLEMARVPYHSQEVKNRTDLILPSLAVHEQNRNLSMVVSVKRTLRERWAEVAEELFNLRSPNVFLFTADENVNDSHVEQICRHYNIHLVVWDDVKDRRFPVEPLVLGYTDWATNRLDQLRSRW